KNQGWPFGGLAAGDRTGKVVLGDEYFDVGGEVTDPAGNVLEIIDLLITECVHKDQMTFDWHRNLEPRMNAAAPREYEQPAILAPSFQHAHASPTALEQPVDPRASSRACGCPLGLAALCPRGR